MSIRLPLRLVAPMLLLLAAPAAAEVIGFDAIPADCCYSTVTPGGPRGPDLVFPGAIGAFLSGGVVMSSDGWAGGATTAENLLGTCDIDPQCSMVGGLLLPGFIAGGFTSPVSFIDLDVINGVTAGTFTLIGFGSSAPVYSSIFLGSFGQPGFVGHLSISGDDLTSFWVVSDQVSGGKNFAIDTISFGVVPEPTVALLLGAGLFALALRQRSKALGPH